MLLLLLIVTVLIIQLIFPISGSERFFLGAAQVYYEELLDAGFPEDYAAALTELHLLHPTWTFSPLLITQGDSRFTWNYVIDSELEEAGNNIIYSSATYSAYHHPTNRELYDSGHYQVSREALEYFMDPRNFLNETDIFQFYSLEGNVTNSEASVEAILRGTFMENAYLENGMTYAQYFVMLGEQLDINPVFLATKVRQEQGVNGTSPLISGACGDKLSELAPGESGLHAYNGYYNYFNINATGSGQYEIYLNAMKYAKDRGTADMADEWGGSGAWNTRWKALYGGAYFLTNNYIGRYQSTVYLQKFNVDSRADYPFKHQYMASVHGAMSEARMLFQSFSTLNTLDNPAHFVIPVYEGMPSAACSDPANGTCNQTAQASRRSTYRCDLSSPERMSATDQAIYFETEAYPGGLLELEGNVTHSYSMDGLYYSWDGGEWIKASNGNTLQTEIACNFLEESTHILVLRGTSTHPTDANDTVHTNFLYAVIYVHILPRPNVSLSYDVNGTITEEIHLWGDRVQLPHEESPNFAGWKGSDGSFLPSDAEVVLDRNLSFSAVFLDFQHLDGAAITLSEQSPRLRFSAVLNKESYDFLSGRSDIQVKYTVRLQENGQESLVILPDSSGTPIVANGCDWVRFDVLTAPLRVRVYQTPYSATFCANIRYSNGDTSVVTADGEVSVRTAKEVAQKALEDQTVLYSEKLRAVLHSVAENA